MIIPSLLISAYLVGCGKAPIVSQNPVNNSKTSSDVVLETEIIKDKETLDKFKVVLFEKLKSIQPTSMDIYHEFKQDIFKYGVSSAYSDNALSRLVELQEVLKTASIYSIDFDEDGAKDIYELLLLNTSPMSVSSKENGKLDGKITEIVKTFVFSTGRGFIVTDPLVGNFVTKAIEVGTINDTVYVEVQSRLHADEISSFIVNPKSANSVVKGNPTGTSLYPISITTSGLKNPSLPGEIYFYHKGEDEVRDSVVEWVSIDKQGIDEYLERNKNYTKTNDIININRTYVLIRK